MVSLGAISGVWFLAFIIILYVNVLFITVIVTHVVKNYRFYKILTLLLILLSLGFVILVGDPLPYIGEVK